MEFDGIELLNNFFQLCLKEGILGGKLMFQKTSATITAKDMFD